VTLEGATVGRINISRVILGGLLAGLIVNIGETILNVVVVADDMNAALAARNLPAVGTGAIVGFVVFAFLLGIVTVWLYAAIRPRFGARVGTAVIAGLAVWFLAYFYGGVGLVLMGFFPGALAAFTLVWGAVEIVIAAVAGAWAYHE
jgi:hypothetical protein